MDKLSQAKTANLLKRIEKKLPVSTENLMMLWETGLIEASPCPYRFLKVNGVTEAGRQVINAAALN